jgi:two-component system cell cycle response regulator DivK
MKKVLVIEDNEDNGKIMRYAPERAGYEVISAGRGEEGVEMALMELPFLIVMDINLPGIDGIESTKRIRASEADGDIPIIAITSLAVAGDREKIVASECNGYIEKPIDAITIVERIHEIIGVKEQ